MLQTFLITALQTSPPFNAYLLDEDFLEYLLNLIILSLSLSLPPLLSVAQRLVSRLSGLWFKECRVRFPPRQVPETERSLWYSGYPFSGSYQKYPETRPTKTQNQTNQHQSFDSQLNFSVIIGFFYEPESVTATWYLTRGTPCTLCVPTPCQNSSCGLVLPPPPATTTITVAAR